MLLGSSGGRRATACTGAHTEHGGSERDRVLRMGVDHDRSPECVAQQPGDQRDLRRAADEQDGGQVLGGDIGGREGPPERLDGGVQGRDDLLLERIPGDGHVLRRAGQRYRDVGSFACRQGLLGEHAFAAQGGQDRRGTGVGRVQRGDRAVQLAVDVVQDGLVEVGAAEPFDALGGADDLQAVPAVAHDRAVERSSAQVVDREQTVRGQWPGGAVVGGRGHRLGGGQDHRGAGSRDHRIRLRVGRAWQAGQVRDGGELLAPVRTPHRRVGQHDALGWFAPGLAHGLQDGAEQGGHQGGGGMRCPVEDHRDGVAEAALELTRRPAGVLEAEPVGLLTDQQRGALVEVGDRRGQHCLSAERDHVHGSGGGDCRGGEAGTQIDADAVHPRLLRPSGPPPSDVIERYC